MRHVGIRFSEVEVADLLKAWLATSLAFGIYFILGTKITLANFIFITAIAAVTAGLGFIGHELMHKFTANHFNVQAEFRSNDKMLIVSILIAFLGVIFAAPGAVQIYGTVSKRENGLISLAGPLTNMVLVLLFLPLVFQAGILHMIGSYGLMINALLGAFNMLPLWGFDGQKILAWHKGWYFTFVAVGIVLAVAAFSLFSI